MRERMLRELRGQSSRKVAHATYLIREDGDIHLRYHDTNVITSHEDGTFTLRNGGYFTATTRKRIEEYAPVSITGRLARNMGAAHDSPFRPSILSREADPGGPWMVGSIEWIEGARYSVAGKPIDFTTEATT